MNERGNVAECDKGGASASLSRRIRSEQCIQLTLNCHLEEMNDYIALAIKNKSSVLSSRSIADSNQNLNVT